MSARRWLVWSCSKRLWWRAQECGYTDDVGEAGRYTDAEALAVVERMNYAPSTGAAAREGAGDPVQLVPANKRWLERSELGAGYARQVELRPLTRG